MKTSQQWWNEVKANPTLMTDWLKDQFHGEVTAAARIREFAASVAEPRIQKTLNAIAQQEADHAEWVKELLTSRGIEAEVLQKEERYWSKTLSPEYKQKSTQELAAIGAHAEAMRLERIKVIANDESAPTDIRMVFSKILPQERYHERAFRYIAGDKEMKKALDAHKEGLAALGLSI